MAVQKFRTFDEARQALWLAPDDPRILLRMRHLARMARARRPVRRGVTRIRTIEEAKRDKGTAWQVRGDL
ncbi:MAG: hypothetical protein U0802_07420 [Candidatus Binatia bacterium]